MEQLGQVAGPQRRLLHLQVGGVEEPVQLGDGPVGHGLGLTAASRRASAFQIHQQARNFGEWLLHSADSLLQTSSEYLREEVRLSPTQVEFEQFQSRLALLKNDVARAEARLQRLLSKIHPS